VIKRRQAWQAGIQALYCIAVGSSTLSGEPGRLNDTGRVAHERVAPSDGVLVAADEGGATNFWPPSFDPKSGLFIVNGRMARHLLLQARARAYGWAGADYGLAAKGFLRAVDYRTRKIVWEHPYPRGSSSANVLTAGIGLTITGDSTGNLLALRASDGTSLWHENIVSMSSAPVSYELYVKRYMLVSGGNALDAYVLP
jgi:alcohol dehydrogenase (cytochrome c)